MTDKSEQFNLHVELVGDALSGEYRHLELARLLIEASKRIADTGDMNGWLHDVNGNTVGAYASEPSVT